MLLVAVFPMAAHWSAAVVAQCFVTIQTPPRRLCKPPMTEFAAVGDFTKKPYIIRYKNNFSIFFKIKFCFL